jgi:hypothetical protein
MLIFVYQVLIDLIAINIKSSRVELHIWTSCSGGLELSRGVTTIEAEEALASSLFSKFLTTPDPRRQQYSFS